MGYLLKYSPATIVCSLRCSVRIRFCCCIPRIFKLGFLVDFISFASVLVVGAGGYIDERIWITKRKICHRYIAAACSPTLFECGDRVRWNETTMNFTEKNRLNHAATQRMNVYPHPLLRVQMNLWKKGTGTKNHRNYRSANFPSRIAFFRHSKVDPTALELISNSWNEVRIRNKW